MCIIYIYVYVRACVCIWIERFYATLLGTAAPSITFERVRVSAGIKPVYA